jgi:ATP-dependent Zn protease
MRLLTENRNQLEALVQALLKEDSLGEEQILAVTGLKAAASDKNRSG